MLTIRGSYRYLQPGVLFLAAQRGAVQRDIPDC